MIFKLIEIMEAKRLVKKASLWIWQQICDLTWKQNMRQAEQQRQQSWKISVHAEFKNFNFRLKATKISPTWKFYRFSIFLKLHNFLLQLRSDSETPPFLTRQRTTLKSRLLAAVHKLRPRRSKNHPVTEVNSPIDRLKHFASKVITL